MQLQDLAIAANAVLVAVALGLAVTGPNHLRAHVLFFVAALLLPLGAFDLTRARDVPLEAWLYCAFYAGGHLANTVFHLRRPDANHSLGPEVFAQAVGIAFAASVRARLDPSLWYRGQVGALVLCLSSLFVMLVVLMVYYQSELVAHPTDDVDLRRAPLRQKSNAALLCCGPTALFASLYVALQHPAWLGLSAAAFFGIKALLPPLPRGWTSAA